MGSNIINEEIDGRREEAGGEFMVFSNGNSFFDQLSMNFSRSDHNSFCQVPMQGLPNSFNHDNNGKASTTFLNLSPPPPPPVSLPGNESMMSGGRKRKRNNKERVVEKPKEVIHVRAKRGQATDSHSLAERVRREKINERLRCLQDLVPGCYKTMGMAVMLDVIINYVQSLQNQIEFLSMKLSAASMYYDFNMEPDHPTQTNTMQGGGTNAYEIQDMVRDGYGGPSVFHSTWSL